jgi:SEC-C motif domain protein
VLLLCWQGRGARGGGAGGGASYAHGCLLRTWHPSARPPTLSLDPALQWTRLAVLQTRDGGLFDATGTVQFRAMYLQQGKRGVLAETSRFVRHDRHWTYLGPID